MRGICKKPKNLKPTNSQAGKRKFWGVRRECGEQGNLLPLWGPHPDRVFTLFGRAYIGNMRTGLTRPDSFNHRPPGGCRMRPDSIRSCPDDWAPYPSGLQENAVRTINPSRHQWRPSWRSTLKHQKNWEKITEIKFPQVSVRTRMYNQLITQSESISKTKQRYKWELIFQLAQIIFLIIENSNRQLNSCNACVCVKTETTRFEKSWQEQPDFLKKRENPWQISQKSNLTLTRV
jgi:hypothetical protein